VQNRIQLTNGEYHKRLSGGIGGSDVSWGPTTFFGGADGEALHAILTANETDWYGSSTDTGIVQVLKLEKQHVVVERQFTFDSSAPGTGTKFDRQSGDLTITGRSNDDTPNCCPKHVDVMRFR